MERLACLTCLFYILSHNHKSSKYISPYEQTKFHESFFKKYVTFKSDEGGYLTFMEHYVVCSQFFLMRAMLVHTRCMPILLTGTLSD